MKVCHNCTAQLELERRPLRAEECAHCASPLHCCRNCGFHDPQAHNECLEIGTEMVRDRAASNFCDAFTFVDGERGDDSAEVDAAKAKLVSLFKD